MRTASRLVSAFSLRRGLAALRSPTPGHLRPLDGLRALAILWVLGFHAAWYMAGALPPHRYLGLLLAPWLLPIWRGDFGVDLFFVLSGFLIGGLLLDEQAATGRIALGRFYVRRLLRLWPALVVAVVLDQRLLHDFSDRVWAPLLYLTNFVSVAQVPMAHTWSLSIEEQFYLVCPWLLVGAARAPLRRVLGLCALAIGLLALAAVIVIRGDFHAIDVEIAVNRSPLEWIRAFDALYAKPWMRAGPLLFGVGAALLYRSPGVMEALARAPRFTVVLAIALAALSTHWPLVQAAPRAVEVFYLASFRTGFGLAAAYLLLLAISSHPVGRRIGRALSWWPFHPIAQLAYAAYLVNPIVVMWLHPILVAHAPDSTMGLYAFVLPIDVLATFAVALPLHLLVERPFMELRPQARAAH